MAPEAVHLKARDAAFKTPPETTPSLVCPSNRKGEAGEMMSKHRVHVHASGDVPFAWESKPGMSKVAPGAEEPHKGAVGKGPAAPKLLPPPPCPRGTSSKLSGGGLDIPLPPCPFQDPRTVPHRYRSGWEDDPFLAAYMECTRSGRGRGRGVAPPREQNKRREVFGVSCKSARDVVEDGVVRLSQLPPGRLIWGRSPAGKLTERDSREHRSLIVREWGGY